MAIVKIETTNPYIKGSEIDKVEAGTILRVAKKPKGSTTDATQILLKTSDSDHPFINLSTGFLWGDAIEDYEFEEINIKRIILK